jgi:hypothetical protein
MVDPDFLHIRWNEQRRGWSGYFINKLYITGNKCTKRF